jgi:hypothetical protein
MRPPLPSPPQHLFDDPIIWAALTVARGKIVVITQFDVYKLESLRNLKYLGDPFQSIIETRTRPKINRVGKVLTDEAVCENSAADRQIRTRKANNECGTTTRIAKRLMLRFGPFQGHIDDKSRVSPVLRNRKSQNRSRLGESDLNLLLPFHF